ncbi:chondroitin AC/alginate lyase [Trametes coccinea BRFM310]|uniref:Chondroitin AC/alginate lyase n=1 Tax=Trametes coccinea (strain BRFM310) TaxID=1353009 RepID=A0A1Y2IKQ8_TRAC3|nr:chondroitin AC/alginate lyase [Trametes coccinea BRFM310]
MRSSLGSGRSALRAALSAVFSASVGVLFLQPLPVRSLTSYANDFVDPAYALSKNFSNTTIEAQATIVQWAQDLASQGPWTVMNKSVTPPSGDKHDYMSWAPYSWPDCSKAGNTTELTPEQIWTTCPYVTKDGQFNPDGRLINDVGAFGDLSDAVLYNALAWALDGNAVYSSNVAKFINTWFIDPATMMNPNLNYAQMARGPNGQVGQHTGVLDLKCMAKLVSGVLILREGKAAEWTSDIDTQLTNWTNSYIGWLTTAKIALEEESATNNHGTFYYNQLAALQILVGDKDGAKQTIEKYFTSQYKNQIAANGDQPLESARTRPFHYRAYNLAAMITNAKLGQYVGYDAWNLTTSKGTTIKSALDYAITQPAGNEAASELWPNVVAVGAVYGDEGGKYAQWMLKNAGTTYPEDAQFLWNQPFSDSGLVKATVGNNSKSGSTSSNGTDSSVGTVPDNGAAAALGSWTAFAAAGVAALSLFLS